MSFAQYKRLFLALLLTVAFAASAEASTKIDPLLNLIKNSSQGSSSSKSSLQNRESLTMGNGNNEPAVEVILKANSPQDMAAVTELIRKQGGQPRSVIQNLVTARIPLSSIDTIAGSDKVRFIEASRKLTRSMNVARGVTGVDKVQDGSGTNGTPYKGKDVIIGIVDSGIDCLHADFKGADGKSRILYYWDQTAAGKNGPILNQQTGERGNGVEYSGADFESVNGQTPKCHNSPDTVGHGTHVSGIAAGSHTTYTGVAPEANIIMVKDTGDSNDIIDAMTIIFQKAKQLNKPVAINLSEGTWLGAHDNSSAFEEGLNALLKEADGSEKKGAAIVVSAGNESIRGDGPTQQGAFTGVHGSINVPKGQTVAYEALIALPNAAFQNLLFSNVWLTKESIGCEIKINGFQFDSNKANKDPNVRKSNNALLPDIDTLFANISNAFPSPQKSTDDGNIQSSIFFGVSDPSDPNSKLEALLLLDSTRMVFDKDKNPIPLPPKPALYTLDIIFKAGSTACIGDLWLFSPQQSTFLSRFVGKTSVTGQYKFLGGDNDKTITLPATASEVISVGSFTTRETWVDKDGQTRPDITQKEPTFGSKKDDISTFSSLGPTADGRVKPDLAAPGEPIISVFSADATPDYRYDADLDNDPKTPDDTITKTLLADPTHLKEEGTSMSAPFVTGMVALMFQKNPTLTHSQIKDLLQNNATKDGFPNAPGATPNNTWGAGKLNAVATINAVQAVYPNGTAGGSGSGCTLSSNVGSFSLGILMILLAVGAIASVRFRKSE